MLPRSIENFIPDYSFFAICGAQYQINQKKEKAEVIFSKHFDQM